MLITAMCLVVGAIVGYFIPFHEDDRDTTIPLFMFIGFLVSVFIN